jgi:2-polyprenyl-3-methyl-5-hydroxy-6-metoxy-1,4-benzoquinol methylase
MRACLHPAEQRRGLFPAQDYITGHRFVVAECGACGFAVTVPQPAGAAMAAYYPAGYYGAAGQRRFPGLVERAQQALYARRVRRVESVAPGRGRVLDVGCGRGLLLREFQRRGWDVQGTEMSETAARYPREVLHLPVEVGNLEDLTLPAGSFDAVTVWHVLEHLPDPRVLLAEAQRLLKPDGALLVGVPNFGGWEGRLARDKFFHLDVPRHLTHLTRPTLAKALAEAGFRERGWSGFAPEYDWFSFVQSAENRVGLRHNLLYNLLRGQGAKVLHGSPAPLWQVVAALLLAAPLGMLSVPATLVAGLAQQAGTMTVLAVKEQV